VATLAVACFALACLAVYGTRNSMMLLSKEHSLVGFGQTSLHCTFHLGNAIML
jgi:hypothetical protein